MFSHLFPNLGACLEHDAYLMSTLLLQSVCPREIPTTKRHFRRCHGTTVCRYQTDNKTSVSRCKTSFSVFIKNGTKEEEADEAMVLVSF